MTLNQLLTYLDNNTSFGFLQGDVENTLQLVKSAQHENSYVSEFVNAIIENCQCENGDCELKREQVVNAVASVRLRYMADDAPVEGFRLVEGSIVAIDAAFNDEALQQRGA